MVRDQDHGALLGAGRHPLRGGVRALLPLLLPVPALTGELDDWARWLLETQSVERPPAETAATVARLEHVRDRVLDAAEIRPRERIADVGAGFGLLALGAVERVGPGGDVLAFDISVDCLEELRRVTRSPNLGFFLGAAEVLPLPDGSVDVVLTRSVLMYVRERQEAAREFFRVLREGGRVSVFEPINRRMQSLSDVVDFGNDAPLVRGWESGRLERNDPMLGFDEHDLERMFRDAGFAEVRVEVETAVLPMEPESLLTVPGAPGALPLLERWRVEHGEEVAARLADRVRAHEGPIALQLPTAYLAAHKR